MLRSSATSCAVLKLVFIAVGGASGAIFRFWMTNGVSAVLGRGFPYGTLAVNVLGSFVMGLLYVYMLEKLTLSAEWRAGLMVGLLGAFTTFSTFSIETVNLLEAGEPGKAILNMLLSVAFCLLACWIGMGLGKQL